MTNIQNSSSCLRMPYDNTTFPLIPVINDLPTR
jgi:hypothetical protein